MSSPARLLLASAPTRRLSAELVASIAKAARDEGLEPRIIDRVAWSDGARDMLSAAVGIPLTVLGAEPVVNERLRGLPGVGALSQWIAIDGAYGDDRVDVIVVDAGSLADCEELIDFPTIASGLLESVLTARLAMIRPQGDGLRPALFEQIAGVKARLLAWQSILQSDDCSIRLVSPPDRLLLDELADVVARCALRGVRTDGLAVHPVTRKKVSTSRARRDQAVVADFADALRDVPVWAVKSATIRAVPKGRSVVGPLGAQSVCLRGRDLTLRSDDDGFALRIPIPAHLAGSVRCGRQGDDLVIEAPGVTRWLALPSVLVRCRAVHAMRDESSVVITWAPSPDTWPAALTPAAAGTTGAS